MKNNSSLFFMTVLTGTLISTFFLLVSDYRADSRNEAVPASVTYTDESEKEDVSSDPFGYFNGKWNLWEFIGDSAASLFQ